jgi:hypothetical protein
MKAVKFLSVLAVAALLLVPATAMAKTNFNISLNLFDCLAPMIVPPRAVIVAPPAPPPVYYYVPCHPRPRTIVKEYHYYHRVPQQPLVEEVDSDSHYYYYPPQHR